MCIFIVASIVAALAPRAFAQSVQPTPIPQIDTVSQARLYAWRMEGMCESGKKFAFELPKAGVCRCVKDLSYRDAIKGSYAARWDLLSKQTAELANRALLKMPMHTWGKRVAEMQAENPYFVTAGIEDQYDTACGGAHGYLNEITK
ncbi:hypothetical protein [Acidiphilium sp. JA12-A1]|uniref:hypothetical protein n=1 Tax=Acidiphilium sp. JA12-A1 TaxID=1464546 RepID=UPI00128F1F79|nr:hypothetical protein [Acidiphilium sp. JA12-A1]